VLVLVVLGRRPHSVFSNSAVPLSDTEQIVQVFMDSTLGADRRLQPAKDPDDQLGFPKT